MQLAPLTFLLDLKEHISEVTSEYILKDDNGTEKPVNIYLQELPPKSKNNQRYAPYVVVRLMNGEDDTAISTIKARIYICTHDASEESWKTLLNLLETIRKQLLTNRLLIKDNKPKGSLQLPLKYEIPGDLSEQAYPLYVGYIDTEWEMAQPLDTKIKY